MGITLERGRFVAAAVVLAVGFGLAGPWLAAQQGGSRHRQLAAVPRSQPRWQVGRYQPAEAVGRRRPRFGLEGVRSRDGIFEPVDRRRPPLHDGGPGGQPVRHRAVRGRRQAAVEGQGRADLAGPVSRAARDADRRRRADLQPGHRGRPGVPRGGDRQGALAQEPAARLRRPGHVGLEVRRVAAHRRRPRRGDPRRGRRRHRGAEQDHRRDDLEGEDPDRRPGWSRRRRLRVGRHLERRGRQAVRAVARPWCRRDPRLGRRVPLGLQQGRERHRQHPDADRAGRLRLRRRRATRPAARCSSWRPPPAAR